MKVYLRLKQKVTQDQLKEILDIVKDISSAAVLIEDSEQEKELLLKLRK
jgi:hypothetical protein